MALLVSVGSIRTCAKQQCEKRDSREGWAGETETDREREREREREIDRD